jgi:hypothetical protein
MTNTTGVTQFESDYYPHGAPRVITSTKDSLLKFQGKQQDTESSLDNVRRMYSPTLARFLPTRIASIPPKPKTKGVPPPQSLNPGTLAASNPVVHPNSLVGSIIGGIGGLLFGSATEGSEGNNPCAAWGCYPGPPDFNFFDGSNLVECRGILSGLSPIQGLGCGYLVTCLEFPFTVGEVTRPPQICRKCFFQPCPIIAEFLSTVGDGPITPANTFFLKGHPNDFCDCKSPR